MSKGLNKVFLLGYIGQDPDKRQTQTGNTVVNMSLATTETWFDKNDNSKQERTEWHRLVLFGKVADIAAQYVKKGDRLHVEGRLQTRKWTDNNGNDRYQTEIVVNDITMLGGQERREQSQQSQQNDQYQSSAPQSRPAETQSPSQQKKSDEPQSRIDPTEDIPW